VQAQTLRRKSLDGARLPQRWGAVTRLAVGIGIALRTGYERAAVRRADAAIRVTNVRGTPDDLAGTSEHAAHHGRVCEELYEHSSPLRPRDASHAMHFFTPQQAPVLSRLALELAASDIVGSRPPHGRRGPTDTSCTPARPRTLQIRRPRATRTTGTSTAPHHCSSWWSWLTAWLAPLIPYFEPETLAFSSPTIGSGAAAPSPLASTCPSPTPAHRPLRGRPAAPLWSALQVGGCRRVFLG